MSYKEDIKYVKLHFASIISRSVQYVLTTGTNTLYFTNASELSIRTNDLIDKLVITKVVYKNFDSLVRLFPFLKEPDLFIHRSNLMSLFNKATLGDPIIDIETAKNKIRDGIHKYEDGYLRYGISADPSGQYTIKALDRYLNPIEMKISTEMYTSIPIAKKISSKASAWIVDTFNELNIEGETKKINIAKGVKQFYLRDWEGLAIPYTDGVTGIHVGPYLLKDKSVEDKSLSVTLTTVGGTHRLIVKKETPHISAITVPVMFTMYKLS